MKRIIIAVLAALILASAAEAKVLLLVSNKSTIAYIPGQTVYVNSVAARWEKILGLKCDTYDCNYVKVKTGSALYTHHGVVESDSLDIIDIASQGGYTMAILVNSPDLGDYGSVFDTSAECITNGFGTSSSNFAQWINRNAGAHKFPIPLMVPMPGYMATSGNLAAAYTGQVGNIARTRTTTHDRVLVDAQGDSIYVGIIPTAFTESIVAGHDSLSWVQQLVWRDDDAIYDAIYCKPTYAWMTVGTGNHKVIYLPYAFNNFNAYLWPTIIGMFEPITPIDVPILADKFGNSGEAYWGTSEDTVSLGVNFKAIKDYAVANGMKIDLLGLTYSMQNATGAHSHPVFKTTAYTYANAYPNNIRITPTSEESWRTSDTYYDWFGTTNAASYSQQLARIAATYTGLTANYPTVSQTRANLMSAQLACATTYTKQDSILMAMAAKGITDIYNIGNGSYGAGFPISLKYHIVGAQRTWIGRGVGIKEIRFHPVSSFWRYKLQNGTEAYGDTLRLSYLDAARFNDNRADFMQYLVPVTCGYWRTAAGDEAVGSAGIRIDNASTGRLATHGAGYQPGMHLNALTFTGGSVAIYGAYPGLDPSRSLFLDVMKQINEQVKMANYIQDTYGTIDQPVFVYQWMEDCKYDRRNNRTYPNNHVSK